MTMKNSFQFLLPKVRKDLNRLTLAKIQGLAELGNWGSVDTPTFLWQESRFHITTEDVSFANGGHIQ